jgi:hypothetical protein
MDHMPPANVKPVCDPRWPRYVIVDGVAQYWSGEGWTDQPRQALLFCHEQDAIQESNRLNNLTA